MTGFRYALDYAEGLQELTGVTKILAHSIVSAVPDAVSGGVTAAVTTALGVIGGPLAAAGGAMAGSLAGKLAKSAVGPKGDEQAKTETGGESRPRARLDQAPLAVGVFQCRRTGNSSRAQPAPDTASSAAAATW